VVVDRETRQVICIFFGNGKKHDFKLFKESKVRWSKQRVAIFDSGYTGAQKIQKNAIVPKKSRKNRQLTKTEKRQNRKIASDRIVNENVIGSLKIFRILKETYRNRIKRFGLRFSLISGIYNNGILEASEAVC
jgi:DDE superfamily endonuclease